MIPKAKMQKVYEVINPNQIEQKYGGSFTNLSNFW